MFYARIPRLCLGLPVDRRQPRPGPAFKVQDSDRRLSDQETFSSVERGGAEGPNRLPPLRGL